MIVGVISDTHGLMRPQALDALAGSELILHAGDIGSPEVLEALRQISPVIAVRGNNDKGAWAQELADSEIVEAGGVFFYVLHDAAQLDLDPRAAGFRAVVSGHSHRPSPGAQRSPVSESWKCSPHRYGQLSAKAVDSYTQHPDAGVQH